MTVAESTEESIIPPHVSSGKKLSREAVMVMASELIELLHCKVTRHRFKESRHDRARLSYARTAVQAIATYGTLLKDAEIEALVKRIEQLEAIKK